MLRTRVLLTINPVIRIGAARLKHYFIDCELCAGSRRIEVSWINSLTAAARRKLWQQFSLDYKLGGFKHFEHRIE